MRRKKVEKDEEYIATVANLAKSVDHAMRQNTALDIYEVCRRARARSPLRPRDRARPTASKHAAYRRMPQR